MLDPSGLNQTMLYLIALFFGLAAVFSFFHGTAAAPTVAILVLSGLLLSCAWRVLAHVRHREGARLEIMFGVLGVALLAGPVFVGEAFNATDVTGIWNVVLSISLFLGVGLMLVAAIWRKLGDRP